MPEGPELNIAAKLVNKVSAGRIYAGKIVKSAVSTKCPDVIWNEDAYSISATSRGKEIRLTLAAINPEELHNDGKDELSNNLTTKKKPLAKGFVGKTLNILFRFGMSGKFEFQSKDNMEKHSHLNFYTKEEGMVLSFVDYRRFGRWEITPDWGPKRGPCIITEYSSFRENVLNNLDKAVFKRPICEALLDQQYFNGMGNYLRAEALYRAKIPPFVSAISALQSIKEEEEMGVKTEQPDLLHLCNILATEVTNLNQGEGYFYDPTKEESNFKTFLDWLQCYYQPNMQNLVDHNGRTIWFSGKTGPLAPKEKRSRERKKRSKKKIDVAKVEHEENENGEKESRLTRNKLHTEKRASTMKKKSPKLRNKRKAKITHGGDIQQTESTEETTTVQTVPSRKRANSERTRPSLRSKRPNNKRVKKSGKASNSK